MTRARNLLLVAIAVLLVAPTATANFLAGLPVDLPKENQKLSHLPSEHVVGFSGKPPLGLLKVLGASIVLVDESLEFVLVRTNDPVSLANAAAHPDIEFVERNGLVLQSAATWDAAQWDAATWDAAQWDAAQWDAAQWDAATWDAAQWDAAQWDAAQWDAAQWDAAQWDAATWDAAQWDAAQWDGTPESDPGFPVQWNLGAMHAPEAWETETAFHSKTICVVDSGIDYRHSDLARNVKRLPGGTFGYDFFADDSDPMDEGGHGTHVAGIASGVMGNGHGIAGVSQAYVIGSRVLDRFGMGTEADLARGIKYCGDVGANIVLLALHTDGPNLLVEKAIRDVQKKGLLVVAASGNRGQACTDCVAYPAAYDGVLAVGASAPDSSIPAFSQGGAALDLVAPGAQIPSLYPGNRYAIGTGTSQAAANAAGAAALVWAAARNLDATGVQNALKANAKDDGAPGFDHAYGNGHLRLDRTFDALGVGS